MGSSIQGSTLAGVHVECNSVELPQLQEWEQGGRAEEAEGWRDEHVHEQNAGAEWWQGSWCP